MMQQILTGKLLRLASLSYASLIDEPELLDGTTLDPNNNEQLQLISKRKTFLLQTQAQVGLPR
jgi:hypothetical protein